MKIGYIRYDKKGDASYEEQKRLLQDCERLFEDSGDQMRELDHMIDYMRAEDHVHVYQLDRFGLNIRDLMMLIYDFLGKGIHISSMQDGIDTSTQEGRVLLKIFKVLNLCEQNAVESTLLSVVDPVAVQGSSTTTTHHSNSSSSLGYLASNVHMKNSNVAPMSSSSTREVLRNAGRPKGLSSQAKEKAETAAAMYQEGALSMRDIAQNLNISTATLYSYLRHEKVI